MRYGRQVAAYAYINGLAFFQSSRDRGIDQFMCIFQIIHHSLEASNSLKTPKLLAEIRQPDGMVKYPVRPVVVGVGPADDADHRQVLAVGPGDGVEHAEPADGERHDAGPDAPGAGVAVGGVPGVELVAAADEVEPRLGDEVVEEREVEVAGDGEDVGDADLDEPVGDVAAHGGVGGGDHRGRGARALDGRGGAVGGGPDVVAGGLA